MAENESLDLDQRGGRRWRALQKCVQNKDMPDAIAKAVDRTLRRLLKSLVKDTRFRFTDLVRAAGRQDHEALRRLVRSIPVHCEYAELLQIAARPVSDPQQVCERWLESIVDRVLDQCRARVIGSAEWSDFGEFRTYRSRIESAIRPCVARLAAEVASHPDIPPRMPARTAAERAGAQSELLSESLLSRKAVTAR